MFTPLILTIPVLVLPLVMPPAEDCQLGRVGDPAADERAVIAFEVAVDEYAALHRRLARPWPPAWFIADPEQKERAAEELRAALREARPQARQGSLFTPEVADVFRFRIAAALREEDDEEGGLYSILPTLPLELEYHMVGRNLIVLDVDANVVVDTLELALPTVPAEPEPELEEPELEEPIAPAAEEPTGCLYGRWYGTRPT